MGYPEAIKVLAAHMTDPATKLSPSDKREVKRIDECLYAGSVNGYTPLKDMTGLLKSYSRVERHATTDRAHVVAAFNKLYPGKPPGILDLLADVSACVCGFGEGKEGLLTYDFNAMGEFASYYNDMKFVYQLPEQAVPPTVPAAGVLAQILEALSAIDKRLGSLERRMLAQPVSVSASSDNVVSNIEEVQQRTGVIINNPQCPTTADLRTQDFFTIIGNIIKMTPEQRAARGLLTFRSALFANGQMVLGTLELAVCVLLAAKKMMWSYLKTSIMPTLIAVDTCGDKHPSSPELQRLLPFLCPNSISTAVHRCCERGLLKKGGSCLRGHSRYVITPVGREKLRPIYASVGRALGREINTMYGNAVIRPECDTNSDISAKHKNSVEARASDLKSNKVLSFLMSKPDGAVAHEIAEAMIETVGRVKSNYVVKWLNSLAKKGKISRVRGAVVNTRNQLRNSYIYRITDKGINTLCRLQK